MQVMKRLLQGIKCPTLLLGHRNHDFCWLCASEMLSLHTLLLKMSNTILSNTDKGVPVA